MQSIRESRYLGGLWEDSLVKDLLWSTFAPAKRPQPWRGPSWSWTSVEGRIQYQDAISTQPQISIIQATCSPAGHDATGEVNRDGRLEVSGVLAQLPLFVCSENGQLSLPSSDEDMSDVVMSIDSNTLVDGSPLDKTEPLSLLRVATQRLSSYPQYCEASIILQKSAKSPEFQRVGVLRVYYNSIGPDPEFYEEASFEGETVVIV
jgi:hypothetical protein